MCSLGFGFARVGAKRWPWKIPGVDKKGNPRPAKKIIDIASYDPAPIRGIRPPSLDDPTRIPLALAYVDSEGVDKYRWCDVTFGDLVKLNQMVHEEERVFFAVMLENHPQHLVIDLDGETADWPQLVGREVEIDQLLRALFDEFLPQSGATNVTNLPTSDDWRADSVPAPPNGPPRKTSVHVNHSGVAFKTQRDLREFVLRFVRWIVDVHPGSLLVNRQALPAAGARWTLDDFRRASPIDVRVYNKDRNMRLSYSRKAGQGKLPLLPMDPNTSLEDALWSSLVCYSMPSDPTCWLSFSKHTACEEVSPVSRKRKDPTWDDVAQVTTNGETLPTLEEGDYHAVRDESFFSRLPPPSSSDVRQLVGVLKHEKRLFGHHDAWRDVVWSIKGVLPNEEGYEIAAEFTKIWEDKANQQSTLESTWQSGRADTFGLGSLWNMAKEDMQPAAYKALWKQIYPPSLMNAARRAFKNNDNNDNNDNNALASAVGSIVFDMSLPENFAFMSHAFNYLSTLMAEDVLSCYFLRAGLSIEQVSTIRRAHRLPGEFSPQQDLPEETQREVLNTLFSSLPTTFLSKHALVLNRDDGALTRRDLGLAEIFKSRYSDRMTFKANGVECYVWNEHKKLYDHLTPDFLHALMIEELMVAVARGLAENGWQSEHYNDQREVELGSPAATRWQARDKSIAAGNKKLGEKAEMEAKSKQRRKRTKTDDTVEAADVAITNPDDPDVVAALQHKRAVENFAAMWKGKLDVLGQLKYKLCDKSTTVTSTVITHIKLSMRDETIDERMNVSVPHEIPILDGLVLNCKDKTVRVRTMQDLYTDVFPVHYHRPESTIQKDVEAFKMAWKYLRSMTREGAAHSDDEWKALEQDDKDEHERLVQEESERLEMLCYRAGYTMLGEYIVKELQIFHGPTGNNGKTGFSNLLDAIMGPTFCYSPETSALFSVEKDTGKQTSWKIPLRYARCSLIAEPPRGLSINDTFVKIVAGGGDKQKAREMFGKQTDSRSFISPATWWVFSNFPLKMRDSDKFSRKRSNVIPALAQFGEDDVEGQRFMKDVLEKYKDYVFSIWVEYAWKFYNDENTKGVSMPPPGKSIVEYKAKVMSGNEPWLCFLRCCEVGKDAEITGKEFWENWELWSKHQKMVDERALLTLSHKDVKERFDVHCGEPRKAPSREDRANKVVNAKRALYYYGLGPLLENWREIALV